MVTPNKPDPVKLFIGILTNKQQLISELESALSYNWGTIDCRSGIIPFDCTDYYEGEMGSKLFRYFISMENLMDPEELANIKLRTNEIEIKFSAEGKRKVNLDPGYLDFHKIVLASGKFGGQKIYLSGGIYADMTSRFSRGKFEPMEWAFPDFKTGLYDQIFITIRHLYKEKMKSR